MLSNCPRCGSSLTMKESVQNWCNSCGHSTKKQATDSTNHRPLVPEMSGSFRTMFASPPERVPSLTRDLWPEAMRAS